VLLVLFLTIENSRLTIYLHLITAAWRLCGLVIVVGHDSYFYLIRFEILEDLLHICYEGLWVVDGTLFVLERWRPILAINRLQLNFISLWVLLHATVYL